MDHIVEFSADDADGFSAFYNELRGMPGVQVTVVPAPPAPGEQGSGLEFLTVACSGGAITVVLQIIKTLVESRGISLKVRSGEDSFEIKASTVDEMLPLVREVLGGRS